MNKLTLCVLLLTTLSVTGCGSFVQIKQEETLYATAETRNASARRFFERMDEKAIGPVFSVGFQDKTKFELTETAKLFAERAGKVFVSTDVANIILLVSVKKERQSDRWMWYEVTVRAIKPRAIRNSTLLLDTVRREGKCTTRSLIELRPCEGFVKKLFEHALYSLENKGPEEAHHGS
jgi:hypothetical protein